MTTINRRSFIQALGVLAMGSSMPVMSLTPNKYDQTLALYDVCLASRNESPEIVTQVFDNLITLLMNNFPVPLVAQQNMELTAELLTKPTNIHSSVVEELYPLLVVRVLLYEDRYPLPAPRTTATTAESWNEFHKRYSKLISGSFKYVRENSQS